jgi:hypothetical protein
MTVQASIDVRILIVRIHGWADIRHRTTSGLPTAVPIAIPSLNPMPSTLPIGAQTPKDDVRCVHPGKAMALATLGDTSPCNP